MSPVTFSSLILLAVMASIASSQSAVVQNKPYYDIKLAPFYFEKFIRDYHRVYKDALDKELHYQAFVKNLIEINEHNRQSSTAVFDINQFADYTEEEKRNMNGLLIPDGSHQ